MDSSAGTQPKRRSLTRRRSAGSPAVDDDGPSGPAPPPLDPGAETRPPETAEIYRSLLNELRRAFGGTIDDSNADAIALAASELYHNDVEPRLGEQRSAQEILDSFGVPRAGAFNRYSLADRLLLLKRSATLDRAEQAHALLTDLGAPETNESGSRASLKERLEWLLAEVAPLPASGLSAQPSSTAGGPEADQLVDPLRTIRQTVGSEEVTGGSTEAPPPVEAPAPDLAGLSSLLGGIQEELIRLRQAVESVQRALEETLQLLRAGDLGPAGLAAGAPITEATPAVLPPESPIDAHDAEGTPAPPEVAEPEPEAEAEASEPDERPEPEVVAPDDVTEAAPTVPVVEGEEVPAAPVGRRRRSLPKLLVIAVVLGLLVAGVAIALSAVGWSEIRGWWGVLPDLVTDAAAPGAG